MTGKPLSREEIDDRRRLYAGVPEKWGDPADVVQARWVATVDARDARIAELEAELLTERRTAKLSLDHIERFDAAVKRAEEAEAELKRDWYREAHEALEAKEAAEQREAAALRELAKAEADVETAAGQHLAALASLEALREEASRFMICALKDVAVAAHKADTLGSVDLERKTALLIEHGRCLDAAIDATQHDGRVLREAARMTTTDEES